jgi:acetyl-CoA carboxylase biotin carboxyl carrier protein
MVDWEIIKKLIQVIKDEEITGLAVEENGVKYEVRRDNGVSTQVSGAGCPPPTAVVGPEVKLVPGKSEDEEAGLTAITSPMVGTFYRSPSPESPAFVDNGDDVAPGKVVCIIEAMKLFNEIEAEVKGKVVKILVENGQPVEYGQKLMLIKKA